jgi:hypothetical protein
MRNDPVSKFLKDRGVTWTPETRNADGSIARIDIAKDGHYIGSVNGLSNMRKVAEEVHGGNPDLAGAIINNRGWYAR